MKGHIDSQPRKGPNCANKTFGYKSSLLRHPAGSAQNYKHECELC